jgi:hypothetical protein
VICTVGKISDVQELMLIVSGVAQQTDDRDVRDGGAAPVRLRWESLAEGAGGAHLGLLRRLGRDDLCGVPLAHLLASSSNTTDAAPWLVSPLSCVAGLDRLHLSADGLLNLPMEQWAQLCSGLARELGSGKLVLTPLDGRTALLEGVSLGELVTPEPDELLGTDLRDCQPRGPAANRWRALQGEIEMWLHAHPVNQARARAGQPPVTTLWPWGGAQPGRAASGFEPTRAAASPAWSLLGLGVHGQALAARHPGIDATAELELADYAALAATRRAGSVALRVSAARGLAELESRWLAPAAAALQRGQLGALTLWHRRSAWRLARRRWWQRGVRPSTLGELFASATAALAMTTPEGR